MALSGIVPVTLVVVFVQLHLASSLTGFADVKAAAAAPSVLGNFTQRLLIYTGVMTGYVLACAAITAWFAMRIRTSRLEPSRRRELCRFAIIYWIVVVATLIVLARFDLHIYAVTYDRVADLFLMAHPAVAAAMTGDLGVSWMSRQGVAAVLPTAVGMSTVVAGAVAATVCLEEFEHDLAVADRDKSADPALVTATLGRLTEGVKALGVVLVGSTVTASLFFHLPETLYGGDVAKSVNAYAATMSVFWGANFTLTLLAVYVPPYLGVRRLAVRHEVVFPNPGAEDSASWLAPLWRRMDVILPLLGPLAAGPAANLLQSLLASGG